MKPSMLPLMGGWLSATSLTNAVKTQESMNEI